MGHLAADARCDRAVLARRRACGPDAFVLELEFARPFAVLAPGRFAMLAPGDGSGPLIPRPFSVYDQPSPARLSFLIQVLGKGTRCLVELPVGAELICTAPLGNGFRLPAPGREVALVAGGAGSAPFLLYARARAAASAPTHFLFGARGADRLYDRASFELPGVRLVLATDDGSCGFAGTVTDCLVAERDAGRVGAGALYCACGPAPLLAAMARLARARGLDCQLSLETYMGCGIGVCNGCPTATDPAGALGDWPYAKACLDGPVFALADLGRA